MNEIAIGRFKLKEVPGKSWIKLKTNTGVFTHFFSKQELVDFKERFWNRLKE